MVTPNKIKMALFFTQGVSLQMWEKGGMLDREIALYQQLQKFNVGVTFVSYGNSDDLQLEKKIPGIRLICNKWGWKEKNYIKWITSILPWIGNKPQIIKSNQFMGADIAFNASHAIGARFIARAGYLPSINFLKNDRAETPLALNAIKVEENIVPLADKVVVTTIAMSDVMIRRNNLLSKKIQVIPNYVQTDRFKPSNNNKKNNLNRLCFIGRLEKEKNLLSLLEAISGLDLELDLIGEGSLHNQLETYAEVNNLRVNFLGNLPNSKLPEIINSANIYIQPSLYEGHPKTIIEAMSCGAAVIGGDSPGIKEIINHRQTGFLCQTTPQAIRLAILEVLNDPDLCEKMGTEARRFVIENFSLEKVVEMEINLYQQLLNL